VTLIAFSNPGHRNLRALAAVTVALLSSVTGLLACSGPSGPKKTEETGSVQVQVAGLDQYADAGGTAILRRTTSGTSPIATAQVPATGTVTVSSVPAGQVDVSYTPPTHFQTMEGQITSKRVLVSANQTQAAGFSVERKTGTISLHVLGLADGLLDGGNASVTHLDGFSQVQNVSVNPVGTTEVENVPEGSIGVDYTPPTGHELVLGEEPTKEVYLTGNQTRAVPFRVEPEGGVVRIQVEGLEDGVVKGGRTVVSHEDPEFSPVWADIPGAGLVDISRVWPGAVQVDYFPPAGYVLDPADSGTRSLNVLPVDTFPVTFPVESLKGDLRFEITGIANSPENGGSALVTHVPGTIDPFVVEISAEGVGEAQGVPVGDYTVEFSPPLGHVSSPGDPRSKPAIVNQGGTTLVPFAVAPVANSIAMRVTRIDGGTGTVLVSSGVPLRPGDLMPTQINQVRVMVEGVEKAVYVEGLKGKHPDGSLRSLLVQFEEEVNDGWWLHAALEIDPGVERIFTDRSRASPPAVPAAVVLPTDPEHLVATGIAIHPLLTEQEVIQRQGGTPFVGVLTDFRTASDAHWNAYGADWLSTTLVYDRAMNHFTFWAMTGDVLYWKRAVANVLESRAQSPVDPYAGAVAPRFYQPDGMGMHYLTTGNEESRTRLVGGVFRLSQIDVFTPENLIDFGGPGESFVYAEGRIRARVLLGALWALLLEDTSVDWGAAADILVNGMIAGQDADGGFTYRLGNDFTPEPERRYGQVNFMEGMVMDAVAKYYILRAQNPDAVTMVQKMVDFLDGTEWSAADNSWHYWSPATAWDMGDAQVSLQNSDELNAMLTLGHYWTDFIRGTTDNWARADAAITQTLGPNGADFGVPWGNKQVNQFFYSGFAQLYYRLR
jgi:hypothetical protein